MGTMLIEEGHVHPEPPLEMPFAEDQEVVQALLPCRPRPALCESMRMRCPEGRADDLHALAGKTGSKPGTNVASRSRMRKRTGTGPSWIAHLIWRACWTCAGRIKHPS